LTIHKKKLLKTTSSIDGVLTKPFKPAQLKRTLNKYLFKEFENETKNTNRNNKTGMLMDNQINQDSLKEYFGEDKDFKKVVFQTFIEEIEVQVEELKLLLDEKQWDKIARLAHKMKPSLAMVGLTNTEDLLKNIESGIKSGGINDVIKGQIDVFLTNFQKIFILVKEEYNKF
jgi:HPt (histidine-containing phosphotransfer) domain-containing protein